MQLAVSDLEKFFQTHPDAKHGCIVDTNVIFATSYPLDNFNEWGEEVFNELHRLQVPIYTNQIVRSEFIDLNRRVVIPEGLVDFFEDYSGTLEDEVESKLRSLKTRKRKAEVEEKTFKLSDSEINEFAELFRKFVKIESTPLTFI
jgi:predicted nucleic acid-binding protein